MSFFLIIMLVKYVLSDGISQAFLPFRFVGVIAITDHDLFWNLGQANYILKYFENMMIDHSDSTIFFRKWLNLPGKYIQVLSISHKMADCFVFPLLL
jgi:hypothetical protein